MQEPKYKPGDLVWIISSFVSTLQQVRKHSYVIKQARVTKRIIEDNLTGLDAENTRRQILYCLGWDNTELYREDALFLSKDALIQSLHDQ